VSESDSGAVARASPSVTRGRASKPHGHTVQKPRTALFFTPCYGACFHSPQTPFAVPVSAVQALHNPPCGFLLRRACTLRRRAPEACFIEHRHRCFTCAFGFLRRTEVRVQIASCASPPPFVQRSRARSLDFVPVGRTGLRRPAWRLKHRANPVC
jgi:hypothetical protein